MSLTDTRELVPGITPKPFHPKPVYPAVAPPEIVSISTSTKPVNVYVMLDKFFLWVNSILRFK